VLKLNIFGDGASFEHVGLAVSSIRYLVGDKEEIFREEAQKVSVAFVEVDGLRVELIEPLGEDSPVSSSLKKGRQLVHLCYRVPDIDAAIEKARANGFHCIARPMPSKTLDGSRITWLFSRSYGLVELVEG